MTMSFVTHLECGRCGKQFEPGKVYNLCDCGSPLLARYDLGQAARTLSRDRMARRPANLWRYREVLPVARESSIVSLGEGFTPLIHAERLGEKLGLPNLHLKDESANPTGSFKARGLAVAVSMARELGIRKLAMPSAGNAGGALAAYAARAGMEAAVFMPEGTPLANRLECSLLGARVETVAGSIKDCGRVMRERLGANGDDGWFDVSTLREPYRLEGKKTMAYELVEQLEGAVPDAIVYPTGGGTGLIGMWKAFAEMEELGWIGARRPRMFAVQSAGCAPVVRAFANRAERAEEWENPETVASGLRVPSAVGDFLILRALRESRGAALAVEDVTMLDAVRELAEMEGLVTSPEGGATLAALKRLVADGFLAGYETVVLLLTGSGYKYVEVLQILARSQ
ncbi:MAG: threonine synthase [Acidobacteria bacterium]|nr:MAG: threonine synthase [Acidobacteriota bacterium]